MGEEQGKKKGTALEEEKAKKKAAGQKEESKKKASGDPKKEEAGKKKADDLKEESDKSFPGFKSSDNKGDEGEYDVEAHKDRIFGKHLQEYMEMLQEEDPTKYEAHFARFIAGGIEDMYTSAHTKIREDPTYTPKEKKGITWTREDEEDVKPSDGSATVTRNKRLTLKARKAKVAAKIKAAQERMLAEAEE